LAARAPGGARRRRNAGQDLYEAGMEKLFAADAQGAVYHFESAVEDFPDSPDAHSGMGPRSSWAGTRRARWITSRRR